MTTSFPEKTFEHWVSQYVTCRFRTHLGQWWPAVGADVEIEPTMLPIGKAIWLELKTATPHPRNHGIHEVLIDVPQLCSYHHSGMPPVYYAVPRPGWSGTLGTTAATGWLAGTARADLAFRRAGSKWFGKWTRVIAGWSLHAAIHRNGRAGQAEAKLGQWDGTVWAWAPGFAMLHGTDHPEWTWPGFWHEWQRCGSTAMPSTLVVPADALPPPVDGGSVGRSELVGALQAYRDERARDKQSEVSGFGRRSIYEPVFALAKDGGNPTGRLRYIRTIDGAEDGAETEFSGDVPGTGLAAHSTMLAVLSALDLVRP